MFSCYRRPISANASERHVRLKGTLVRLPIGLKKRGVQCGDVIGGRTVCPEQAGPTRLRPVADMLEDQPEIAKTTGHAAKLPDRVGYRSLIPRRHKSEVNIGRRDRTDGRLFENGGKLRELSCDLWCDLQAYENARRRSHGCRACLFRAF